jgi:D-alanyl-D-alanine carboxypeptidase/D-alanyl-D-alanine-endopeptidase (penicillin-binding protein 4)
MHEGDQEVGCIKLTRSILKISLAECTRILYNIHRMMNRLFATTILMLLVFWPGQAQETASLPGESPVPYGPERVNTASETSYLRELSKRGFNLDRQGLLIESLDGSVVLADHLSDTAFNPASVIKLATSFAALHTFGADYQFETGFYTDGVLNKKTRTLKGNLILHSTGNPMLQTADVTRLVQQLIKTGVARVNGDLVITGPFAFGRYYKTDTATRALQATFKRLGLKVTGTVKKGPLTGEKQAIHISQTLRDILFLQNAQSNNPIAERLGEAVGGPAGVKEFLVQHVGIEPTMISISRTSGLSHNRITPRGTVTLLREMIEWLYAHELQPEDIMPVAGVDPGTLRLRFNSTQYRGMVVGKTGTLPGTDGGVSTLAGLLYTRDRGPLLFAIFNNKGSVATSRRLQDGLIKALAEEFGGFPEINASSHRSNN